MRVTYARMSVTLREARKRAGLTQEQLANKSGVDQTSISRLETTHSQPTDETRERLAKALGIRPVQLRFTEPRPDSTVNHGGDRPGQTQSSDSGRPTHAGRGSL